MQSVAGFLRYITDEALYPIVRGKNTAEWCESNKSVNQAFFPSLFHCRNTPPGMQ